MYDFLSERRAFLIKAAVLTLVILLFYAWFMDRFYIARDSQENTSLPWRTFLVDTRADDVEPGDLVAFKARNTEPYIDEGRTLVKVYAATDGDKVEIYEDRLLINGEPQANGGLHLTEVMEEVHPDGISVDPSEFVRSMTLNGDGIFALGTEPASFDSRFYGLVEREQIQGRAYPLF